MTSVCIKQPEAGARLLRPPDVSLHDVAEFWGAFFNMTLPINWFISFLMEAYGTGRSE